VLAGFTLTVPDQETVVIIGYSGTGKSVALKHVVGLLQPDAGTSSLTVVRCRRSSATP